MSLGLWLTLLLSVVLETQTIDEGTLALAVASCDQVLPEHCSSGPEPAAYHVVLRADPALTVVQIDVHRERADGPLTVARTLTLDAAAPREERARTLGLVIAAQVMGQTPEPSPPPAPLTRVTQPTKRAHHALTLDAGAWVGAGLDRGAPRVGGMVRGTWRPARLGLVASLRGAARPGEDPRLWWLGLSAGAVAHVERGRWAGEARAELLAQRLQVVAEDPMRRESESAYRLGGQLGLDALLRVGGAYWLFAGAEAALMGPPVTLRLRGREYGSEPRVGWAALLGFRHAW